MLLFSDPDPHLLQESYCTIYSVKKLSKETGLRVIDAKSIISVVAAIPHTHKMGEETDQRYFIWEQMGMDMALHAETLNDIDEIDNDEL